MPKKLRSRTDFEKQKTISAFYSGGKVGLLHNSKLLLCPYKETVNIIDTSSGQKLCFAKHDEEDEINSFCFTTDILITISNSLLVKKWSLKNVIARIENNETISIGGELECERTWKAVHKQPVTCCEIDSSGSLLATGSADTTTKIYDLTRQYHTHNIKNAAIVRVIKFWIYQNEFLVVSADDSGQIQITHLVSKATLFKLTAHYGAVLDFEFDSEQKWFVSLGRDCLAIVWTPGDIVKPDTSESMELKIEKNAFTMNELAEAVIVPTYNQVGHLPMDCQNSRIFITVGSRGVFKIWDSCGNCLQAFGKLSSQISSEDESSLAPISHIEQLGGQFVAASHNNDIFMYNLESLKIVKMFSGDPEEISATCFVGNNRNLLAIASKSKFLKLLNLETSHVQITCAHSDVIISVCSSTDGMLVATTSKDKTLKLWKFDSEKVVLKCVGSMVGHTMDVLDAEFFVDNNDNLCSVSEDLTLKIWKIKLPSENVHSIKSLKCTWTVKAHAKQINCCKVSPNNELTVTGSHDKLIKVWDVKNQTLYRTLTGHRKGIWALDFSKQEQLVVSASGDTTVKLWNLITSTCMATFEGHDCAVIQVSFFNRSSQIVSSATNGLPRVWDAKSSECITTLDGHTDKVWSLSVFEGTLSAEAPQKESETKTTSNDLYIVSGGADASIVIWKDVTAENRMKKFEEQNEAISQMQNMENLLLDGNYLEAIKLAIKLNQPFKLLSILEKILSNKQVASQLEQIIADLPQEDLLQLLKFCVIWNSNSKNCHSAQILMEIVFKTWSPDTLIDVSGMSEVVEQLLCYQERHLDRLERLQREAALLNFTAFCVKETASIETNDITMKNSAV